MRAQPLIKWGLSPLIKRYPPCANTNSMFCVGGMAWYFKMDTPSLQVPLAPPPGFRSPRLIRATPDTNLGRFPTPPADGPPPYHHHHRRHEGSQLSELELEELRFLAGPDDPAERPHVLSSLQAFEHLVERAPKIDVDEESSFDGVSTRQLEEMRLLQVQQEMLLVEQAQLEGFSDPAGDGRGSGGGGEYELPPPPPAFDSDHKVVVSGVLPLFVGGSRAHGTLPGYLPAPSAFADIDDDDDEDDEDDLDDDEDDLLADLMSAI
jgi:hypothetical protein